MPKEFIVTPFENIILNTPPKFINTKLKKYRLNLKHKIWSFKNREKERERGRKYRKDNPEKNKERWRKYKRNNPEKYKKAHKKATWRKAGLNMENFEEIYDRYINTSHCDMCEVLLTVDTVSTKTTKCMEHSHISGELRGIVCHSCNAKLPKHT